MDHNELKKEGRVSHLESINEEFIRNISFEYDSEEKLPYIQNNWDKKLLQFLSSPIAEIEREWSLKNKKRVSFLNRFFGISKDNTEKKCARIILDNMSNFK